jgi:hypothetical protein
MDIQLFQIVSILAVLSMVGFWIKAFKKIPTKFRDIFPILISGVVGLAIGLIEPVLLGISFNDWFLLKRISFSVPLTLWLGYSLILFALLAIILTVQKILPGAQEPNKKLHGTLKK